MRFQLSGKPLGKRVLVMPEEVDTMVGKSRILYAPVESQKRPNKGRVIQVGPDVTSCKPGDEVLYGEWSGNYVNFDISTTEKDDDKDFLLMLESDLTYIWSYIEPVKEKPSRGDKAIRKRVKTTT